MGSLTVKNAMLFLLLAAIAIVVLSILRRHKLIDSALNLDDLLLGDDGKMSKAAVVMLGAFLLTSWGMVFMWINKTMTEGYFLTYCGVWATPAVTVLITKRAAPPGDG